jgi:benzoate transport
MSTTLDPLKQLQQGPMKTGQWIVVAICLGILALDGYDVLSIAFAAPGITAEWGLDKATLGVVLSLELMGMALGSIIMGAVTDSHGRRPTMFVGLFIVTAGMLAAGLAPNVYVLGAARIFTGIGIGGLLASATATSSDFCNDKNRALAVTLVAGGFAFGIYLGATFLGPLLKAFDWRITFYLGAAASLLFFPLVYFFVPETISYLERKRPVDALQRIQSIMTRLGHSAPTELPPAKPASAVPVGLPSLFRNGWAPVTIILILAYVGNVGTYYYFVKWIPKLVSDVGFTASQATEVLGLISLGGVIGSIGMSIASRFVAIQPMMILSLVAAGAGVAYFPHVMETLAGMKQLGFVTGVFIFAAISGFFALWASTFPSSMLGSGSGLVLGVGRGGAVLGPTIPGFLFAAGVALPAVALIMAAGSLSGGLMLLFLKRRTWQGEGQTA